MQTKVVIEKIRWINEQVSGDLEKFLFPGVVRIETEDVLNNIINASIFFETISKAPLAVQVLEAFELKALVDRKFFEEYLGYLTGNDDGGNSEIFTINDIPFGWRSMINAAECIEGLTTPVEMLVHASSETFISFELASRTAAGTGLSRLAKATGFAELAYETIEQIYAPKETGSALTIIKIESGSEIRIDCKGLGEPIKHLKALILESWHKLRHKRPEEVLMNAKAALESLAVIAEIKKQQNDKVITRGQADKLRTAIIDSVCGLFANGVLINDIPATEKVENATLIENFTPKLLAPPKVESSPEPKKTVRKKAVAKKKTAPKKAVTRKAAPKKAAAKKSAPKKATPKKAAPKKTAPKKAAPKKAAAKKVVKKKVVAKKAAPKNAATKKAAPKKAAAKKNVKKRRKS